MATIRHLILTLTTFFYASIGLAQEIPDPVGWCQQMLWDPVGVPSELRKGGGNPPDEVLYALSLSGGGYRAMLFHIGTLHRLNDARRLSKLKVVSSVSGGSITAAVLAHRWEQLKFDPNGYAENLREVIEEPLRDLAGKTIGKPSVLEGALGSSTAPKILSHKLNSILFATASRPTALLTDIRSDPTKRNPRPIFIFLSTNLQTGELMQFRGNLVGGPQIGWTAPGDIALSDVVAASAGFPPFFAPLKLKLPHGVGTWLECSENRDNPFGIDPRNEPARAIDNANLDAMRKEVFLADGGIRDNLGVSAIEEINRIRRIRWNAFGLYPYHKYNTVTFISDGGAATAIDQHPSTTWLGVFGRVTSLMSDQPNDLRIENIVRSNSLATLQGTDYSNFMRNPCDEPYKKSLLERDLVLRNYVNSLPGDGFAYWSIRRMPKVHVGLQCPEVKATPWMREEVRALASVPTDLAILDRRLQARLINWGYLSAHHGMPYISELVRNRDELNKFLNECKMPFSAVEVDPDGYTASARDALCLPFREWNMPYSRPTQEED